MAMGETHDRALEQEEQEDQVMESCDQEVRCRSRRNAMWNIFEGVEEDTLLHRLAGVTVAMAPDAAQDAADSQCLPSFNVPEPSESSPSDSQWFCERAHVRRSYSTTAGEEMQAALLGHRQRRRNAVGNLFDLLSPSQKLLLVEHLQGQVERLQGLHNDLSEDLAQLSSSTGSFSSNSSSGSGSSPRGEIVCR